MTSRILDLAPGEAIDLAVDWSGLAGGSVVLSARWRVTGSFARVRGQAYRGEVTRARVEGVGPGEVCLAACRVVTVDGLVAERTFLIRGHGQGGASA